MADEVVAPTQAPPKREFKIPVEHAATHEHAGKQFKIPVEYIHMPQAEAPHQDTSASGLQAQAAKSGVDLNIGTAKAYEPSWWERTKNVVRGHGTGGAISDAARAYHDTGDATAAFKAFANHPLADASQWFDANPKSKAAGFAKGAAGAVSGMTSPTQLAMMAAPLGAAATGVESVAHIAHAVGTAMLPTVAQGLYEGSQRIKAAREAGDSKAESEAWGDVVTNVAMIAVPHFGGKLSERIGYSELNDHANNKYGKSFTKLDDEQKSSVLYGAVADASPKFKKRIQQESDRMMNRKVPGEGGRTYREVIEQEAKEREGEAGTDHLAAATEKIRVQAAKSVINRVIEQKQRAEQQKAAQSQAEARIREQQAQVQRQQQYEAEKAQDPAGGTSPSIESQRGYPINDDRVTSRGARGTIMTTERDPGQRYDPEPGASVLPKVNDERPLAKELVPVRRASELERPVQEFAEQKMGASFSSLPLDRQKVVARYFERFQPEKWDAFKGTNAYDSYQRHAAVAATAEPIWERYIDRHEGSGETLQPGADQHVGLARLLMARTDLSSSLKASPQVAKELNEYTEKNFGPSFEGMAPEDKAAALGGYLRDNPERADTFMTPDVAERVKNGQHIDLANMEDLLRNRQQAEFLMQYRDVTRAAMDAEFAGEAIRQQREAHTSAVRDQIRSAMTQETAAGEALANSARGLASLAEKINLDNVSGIKDMFHVERLVRQVPEADRSAVMREYLAQAQRVRVAAEDQVIQEYRESLTRELRAEAPAPSATVSKPPAQTFEAYGPVFERAAREVAGLEDQRQILNRQADHLSGENATPEQKAEAQEIRDTEKFIHRKEDAVVAAHGMVTGRTSSPAGAPAGFILGREASVVLDSGERVPVHYAVVDASKLIPSHQTFTYEPDARFPMEAQPRDYQNEKPLQAAVEVRAADLDPGQILTETTLPVDGPPIVRSDGAVIGGNGRTQSMKLAMAQGGYGEIRRGIFERAAQFGIDPNALRDIKDPVLVRVMDVDPKGYDELVKYGLQFNREPGMGMSEAEQQIAFARLMTPEVTRQLAGVLESLPENTTIRTAMRMRNDDIGKILRGGGFVSSNKMAEFFGKDGELTERAKEMVENTLAGLTVSNSGVIERASAATRDRLARVGVEFLRLTTAGEKWNITSPNTDAVELLTRAQDQQAVLSIMRPGTGVRDESSLVERMLHPERFTDVNTSFAFDDQPTHAPVNPVVEGLAMALEENPKEYAKLIHQFVAAAVEDGTSIFGARSPAEVFTDTIGAKFGIDVLHDEWGMVGALPEATRVALIEANGPLPLEPAVHAETAAADVRPDSTPVTSVEKVNEPQTVTEFRRELAKLEGFTEEQAQAVSDIFENVLPRAIDQSFEGTLKNRMLRFRFGGEEGKNRAVINFMEDGTKLIQVFKSGDPSSVMHEMAHFVRQYLSPGDQATLNEFVGAKPGSEWTTEQEEKFAQAFERYHFDGGRRKGALEKAFATIHRAMQSVYNAITGHNLAKASPAVEQMFDRWYDWTRSERKPIAATIDVDKLVEAVKDPKVALPKDAKFLDGTARVNSNGRVFIFVSKDAANDFIDRNSGSIRTYGLYEGADKSTYYVKAEAVGKRLYQPGVASLGELARQAKGVEEQLKRTTDPREEARLRAMLNSLENRMGGATLVFGTSVPRAAETMHQIHGMAEMPSVAEPTTPAQAAAAQQVFGDPTEIELGGEHGRAKRVSDAVPRNEPNGARGVSEGAGRADGEHEAAGQPLRGDGGTGRKRPVDPMDKVPAAALKAPERPRGTPVVNPEVWKEHAEALGLPAGTPPPTIRIPQDLRDTMIYPGQPEAIEVALSGLQQHDGVVVAAPTGSGKTYLALSIADQLLGSEGNKVGLVITRSRNLIHESDGYVDVGRRLGVEVEGYPKGSKDIQGGGVYAATYAQIRGDKGMLSVPWDFVIFDESAEGRKWMDSEQGKAVVLLGHAAKKVVYMSATPFHTAVESGYMHKLGLWPQGGFFEWARQFGVVETGPNSYTGGYAPKKLMKLRQQLIERGQWVTLHRDMDGVAAHVGMVKQTPEVRAGIKSIRDTFALAAKIFTQQGKSAMARAAKAHEVIYLKRYVESARLPHAIEAAQKAIENGWSPIIFSEYRSGTDKGMAFFDNLPEGMAEHLNKMLPPLPNVVDAVRGALGDKAAIFAGEANQLRGEEREAFMGGQKQAVYATYAAGGVGVGFHDKVGDRPRMGIFLGLPWSGIMFEQSLGRTWRYGTKSDVANLFLTSDTLPEMKLLATKILPRMRALNAAVYGEAVEGKLAKMLRESAGIHEDMIDYEMGGEDGPSASQFETTIDDKDIQVSGPEVVHGLKAKDARGEGKGMKYKQPVKRLYQGPADQFGKDAADAVARLLGERGENFTPQQRWAMLTNKPTIQAAAAAAGRDAAAAGEPAAPEIERVAKDAGIGLKLAMGERGAFFAHDVKRNTAAAKEFAKDWVWLRHTSGEQAVRKYMAEAGDPAGGREIQRKLIERSHLKTAYQGELLAEVAEVIGDISPKDHPLVVRVLEGKEESADPKILKAVKGYQDFFADVRKRLGDAGAKIKFYDAEGKEVTLGYNQIEDDANYWPHIYDWNKQVQLKDGTVVTLGEIHDMPTNDARRERLVEAYAAKRGITKPQADNFFSKNRRSTRLAGNLEKGRRTSIPDYDETQRALGVYVNQVAEMLANIKTVGQYREKINPSIMSIPDMDTQKIVNSIVTADLNPMALGEENKRVLRLASQWTVLTKMGFSSLKLPFHSAKTTLVTNTRSLIGGILSTVTSPREAVRASRDAGILTDYVRQAMMMEYGLHAGGLDQKMLTLTGFTPAIWLSRIVAGASGRVFLERYAAPALAKSSADPILRRKLKDLYAFTDADMDRIAQKGYDASDVKRAMIAAADWTTGSGRPSELPAALRIVDEHPITRQFNAIMRLTWQLKTFTFKTANLVNRTVVEGMKNPDWREKDYKALGRLLVNFGAAGLGLRMMQIAVNSVANPAAAEEEKRRIESALTNPKDALWLELGNVSYALGLYPAKVLFDRLGTHNTGDIKKMEQQKRLENALFEQGGGILASDMDHIGRAGVEWMQTFAADGVHHKATPEERRSKILSGLAEHVVVPVRMAEAVAHAAEGKKPAAEAAAYAPTRRRRPARRPARR